MRLLLAALAALSLLSAVDPAPASAKTVAALSASASPTTVLTRNAVTIAGTATPRGSGIVDLQRYVDGHWSQLTHRSLSPSGTYSFSVRASAATGTTIYRVVRPGKGTVKTLASKTMHVHVTTKSYKVTAAGRAAVAGGTPITVTGSVSPKAKGSVQLQVLQHGAWRTLTTAKLSSTSTFVLSKLEPTGRYALRVRSPLTTTIAAGVSKSVTVVVTAAPAAPTVAIALAGTAVAGTTYSGTVVATATSTAPAGLKSLTYSLDGAADKPYATGISVSSAGPHTLKVTVTDDANRTATASRSWTIQTTSTDTTKPTATVALGGAHYTGTVYGGPVTVTVTASDSGSGVKSVTYSLDGAAAVAYSAPFTVSTLKPHTVSVTVTDNANNVFTSGATTWSQVAADTTDPVTSIALTGTHSGTVYSTNVTATVTSSDTGGSGLASVTYSLDNGPQTPYTAPIVVTTLGSHTLSVTATDAAGNFGSDTSTWSQTSTAPDNTAPVASVTLTGTGGSGSYSGTVVVTASATDAGSGVASVSYQLDTAATVTSSANPVSFSVATVGTHTVTVTAKDFAGNVSSSVVQSWTQSAGSSLPLLVSSTDQATLGLPTARLVFSAYRGGPTAAARVFTLTNTTGADIQVSGLTISGDDASSFRLSTDQPTAFTVPAGSFSTVSVEFHPTDPTGCPSSTDTGNPPIGDVNRDANLVLSTDQSGEATATADLSGINACYVGGNNEPVLDQILTGLGYTDNVYNGYDRRYIGASRYIGNDEIVSPYFVAADSSQPVSLVPVAHYGSGNTSGAYQTTGWYAQSSPPTGSNSTCSSACKALWQFPADSSDGSGGIIYNQNQKTLPSTTTGTTTFNPTGAFGLYSSDFSEVNFTDDALNTAHNTSNVNLTGQPHYLHQLRVYPAYGPGHVLIPNTYLIGDDLSRVPSYKNNDYQDVVLLLTNAAPAVGQGRVVTASGNNVDLTKATVGSDCSVSGFDGVMPFTATTTGNNCDATQLNATNDGLAITSTPGQLADHNQQNALYQTFDASRGAFTVSTTVVDLNNPLQENYQQLGAFFGPDSSNFIKIEAEHNGTPGLTLFYEENGTGTSAASVSPAGLTSASTLQLVIKGNTNTPDPIASASDPDKVHGYPLGELTVWYSIDGGTLTQIGPTIEFPKNVTGWFSRQAKAGILTANPGTTTPITATFSKFSITAG